MSYAIDIAGKGALMGVGCTLFFSGKSKGFFNAVEKEFQKQLLIAALDS